MVRKLFKSLLSLSLIAPLSAFAIGLGEVHLHSALSERLQANIDLLSVTPAEANNISVSLASQDTFDKVGLERPSILMYLQFEVTQDANGNYVIQVTSREPITEPFLDFLIEVDWKSGRVLREYTLLLDPPSGYQETAPVVATPAATTAPQPTTASKMAPAESGESAATVETTDSMMAAEPSTAPDMAEDTMMGADAIAAEASVPMDEASMGSLVYGPVKANETLWRIAQQMRPNKDISVQQMMMALLKANPYAFYDNNINRLKRGYVLRIDDPEILTAMSKADASREVARQTRAWQDYREAVASKAMQRPADTTAVKPSTEAAVAAKKEPKLKLVAPEGKAADSAASSGTTTSTSAAEMNEELMLAMESAAAQRKENADLKDRLSALEGQITDMEKILALKDADLAALQQQLREQGKAGQMPSAEQVAAAAADTEMKQPELVVKEGDSATSAKPEEKLAMAEAATAEMPVAEATVAAKEGEATAKPETQEAVTPETKPEQVKPAEAAKPPRRPRPVVPAAPVEPPSFIDTLLQDTMMLGAIGGAVVLILVLLLIMVKRRRKGGFQESILNAGGTTSMMKASDEQGSETSFLSDLAISGMGPGTIQTDEGEADPITEAEVFMAYGRNQQAEEVLKKAREVSPDRIDIAAKLLEVYYNSKDSVKFEALAEETVGSLQADESLWGKVLAMGHELCPQNVLFEAGAASAAAASTGAAAPAAADNVMDIGLDLDEISAEMEGEAEAGMDLDLGLDFSDLEEDSSSEPVAAVSESLVEEEEGDEQGALDYDVAGIQEDLASLNGAAEESGGLDFDLDLSASEEAADEGMDFDLDLGASEEAADEGMEFDLGALGAVEEEPASSAEEVGFDLDLGDLGGETDGGDGDMSFDMDLGDLDTALDDLGDLSDLGELDTGEDEVATKLDLAQAYAEMGDAEGARSMLEEVVAAGSAEQKQQAQALIEKL